jgi:hypothetical protein
VYRENNQPLCLCCVSAAIEAIALRAIFAKCAKRDAQYPRNAIADRGDFGLHRLVGSIPIELPAFGRNDGRAWRVARPFIDQSVDDPLHVAAKRFFDKAI